MPAPKRLLLLGLDAATPALLKAWAADGTLPNIAALLASGLVVDTQNHIAFEGSTWPSFFTGLNVGRHGFYWQEQLISGTYRLQECVPGDWGRPATLWDTLSSAGRRVIVLDVPLLWPAARLNGVQSVEWGGHDRMHGFQTLPRGLQRAILDSVGRYAIPEHCDVPRSSPAEYRRFADRLLQGVQQGARLAGQLLRSEPWDCAIHVFGESHCAGHQLWHFHDPRHPAYDAAVTAETGDLIREVYVALDRAVGEVLSGLAPDTTVVLLTLHSMTHTWGAGILLPEILVQLGVTHWLMPGAPPANGGRSGGLGGGLRSVYRRLPAGLRQQVYELRQRVNQRWLRRGSPLNIDPHRSRCFYLHLGRTYSGIRLNLRGREPFGILGRGEAERFAADLATELLALTDPRSGVRLVRRVVRIADHFRGELEDQLPDLVVDWNPEFVLGTAVAGNGAGALVQAASPRFGVVEAVNTYCRTGDHELAGMFVARGPGIAPGSFPGVVANLDLAPTFARWLGCEMRGTDGRPLPELLARLAAG